MIVDNEYDNDKNVGSAEEQGAQSDGLFGC